MDSTAMDPIGNKYWGLWAAAKRSSRTTTSPIPAWAASYGSGGEPTSSWEEQAFARDAAAHLGGCGVWPPRSYSCSFCHREFRSAQALGGHMNVHRRDRALLRQRSSPDNDVDDQAPGRDEQPRQQGGPLLLQYRSAATSNPSTTMATTTTTTVVPPSSYLATIIKENKNKLSSMAVRVEAMDRWCDHRDDDMESVRMKRRRLLHDHPLQLFVQQAAPARESQLGGHDHHDAKVLNTIITTSSNSSSPPPVDEQEVDLELRLGTSPKVT